MSGKKKVLVGISGGVDSTLTAILLKEQGYEVVGGNMSFFDKDKSTATVFGKACYDLHEKDGVVEAQKIADEIGIPLVICKMGDFFEKIVLENFKKEYMSGRTPNPCVHCNYQMKFNLLPKLVRENGVDFEYFATGHYAICEYDEKYAQYVLKRGLEPKKDQSYFLYRLNQEQLSKILFPLGKFSKEQTREMAKQRGLTVYDKPDSQDFYSGNYNDILQAEEKLGNIVDVSGNILGKHCGFWNYTLGQRKGLGIAYPEPLYVLSLRPDTNEVVVGKQDETYSLGCRVDELSFILPKPKAGDRLQAKIRSTMIPCEIIIKSYSNDEKSLEIEFVDMQKAVAPGQSLVIYDGEYVVGGGIIFNKF